MPSYKHSTLSATPANAAPYWTFNTPTRRAWVREISISLVTAVASQVDYGTPTNEATPPVVTSGVIPVGEPADAAATARVGVVWGTAPTAPTTFRASTQLAGVIGSGWVWAWPKDIADVVQIAGWRTLWNRGGGTAGQLLVSISYEE